MVRIAASMTVSDDHDEYAAAATQPKESNVEPYKKAAVTFVLTFLGTLFAQQQGVDLAGLSGGEWASAAGVALVTTVGMFFTKYQSTRPGPENKPAG